MTQSPPPSPTDYAWEKADAPRISNARWAFAVAVFILWLLFLAAMAVHRWIVTLQ